MTETTIRNAALSQILRERRRQIQDDVRSRIRGGRTDRPVEVRDDLELSDADSQGDIAFALLQMRAEMLTRIDEALLRLDAGRYGCCSRCEIEISEPRLRAMPFAVRCEACEDKREREQGQHRLAQRRTLSPFADVVGS